MILTEDQQKALSDFKVFLKSDSRVFILRGAAGTGKTTILKEFIKIINDYSFPFEILTPTGRAALISRERTGYSAATIHRLIYGIKELPKKENDRYIFELKENHDSTNAIYFIDEASMVSDKFSDDEMFIFGSGRLLNDLFNYCNIFGHNRRIVFIGDHAQLPPVGQSISPALSEDYLKDNYNVIAMTTTLNDVVRQALESLINQNSQQIRMAIENRNYSNFSIKDGVDVNRLDDNIADFVIKYEEVAKHSSVKDCIVVTYSNSVALEYNQIIRKCRYGQPNLPIRSKDLLLITRNNYSNEVELFNGTIVPVVSVENIIETQVAYVGKEKHNLCFRRITILAEGQQISTLILDDFLMSNEGTLTFTCQKALWANFEQRMNSKKIIRDSDEFKAYMRKDKYLNALQCKYGYAITCHKAQGGEWQNVFVDMNRSGGKACEDYFRWAYTAITRAKEHLWHISAPKINPFDKIDILPITKCSNKHISYYYPSDIDFKDLLYDTVKNGCLNCSIELNENREISYQHRFKFCRDGKTCTVSVWYGNKGYSGKIDVLGSDDDSLKEFAISICKYQPKNIPYTSKFEVQKDLHNKICMVVQNSMSIVNIVQNQWSDVYYFEAKNEVRSIEFFYNSKYQYTKVISMSSVGQNDDILLEVLDRILDKKL